jgi:hypothetical protein
VPTFADKSGEFEICSVISMKSTILWDVAILLAEELELEDEGTRVVRKRRFPMIFHNEKHVYWH